MDETDEFGGVVMRNQPEGSLVVNETVSSFQDKVAGRVPPATSTGIRAIDQAIIGFRGGKMYVIGARPGMGKTSIVAGFRRAVVAQGHVVCEFHLEMAREEVGEREVSFISGVDLRKVMSGRGCSPEDEASVAGAMWAIPNGLWWPWDDRMDIGSIVKCATEAGVRARHEGRKVGLVIIDYLQLMADEGTEGRQQSVSKCSRQLKLLAKSMDTAVVVLSQLNRNCEFREDKRPLLSDIRESGAVEQDADLVAFLYRHCQYDESFPKDEAEFIIRKQRAGPTGTVKIRFNPRTVHFDDFPEGPVPEQKAAFYTPSEIEHVLETGDG